MLLAVTLMAAQSLLARYEGTLPCADCSGIQATLTLNGAAASPATEGTFTLAETYQRNVPGEENRTIVTTGHWTVRHGRDGDSTAVIYELIPDPPGRSRYFQRTNESDLRLLDAEMAPIASALDYTLHSVGTLPSVGGYTPIATDAPDVKAAADFAMRAQSERSGHAERLLAIEWAEQQVVAGTNYRLCLVLATGSTPIRSEAVVSRDLEQRFALTSWTAGTCR
jgi:copper homeostasis protein (lipoprotein)